jgi:hypothetical protein
MAVSDSDVLFGRFDSGTVGTWRWTLSSGWSLLTGNRPDVLHTDAAGEMVGSYGNLIASGQQGTWRWNPTTGWARLSTAEATILAVSADGAIFESRGTTGIWRAAPGSNTFTQIDNTSSSIDAFDALPDGGLFLDRHITGDANFTAWYWNGGIGLVNIIPNTNAVFVDGVGKDGDVYFSATSAGTAYWSLAVAYHTLGTNTEYPGFIVSQR